MDAYRNLGGLGLFCNKSGVGGVVGDFLGDGVGGAGTKEKIYSDFRRPEVGISVCYSQLHPIYPRCR